MKAYKVVKIDGKIDLNILDKARIIKRYQRACLLKSGDTFLSLLAAGRSPLPDSVVIEAKGFSEEIPETPEYDFSSAEIWNSDISNYGNTYKNSAMKTLLRVSLGKGLYPGEPEKMADEGRLSQLIGRGVGLTPSGDDFITGALMAAAAFSDVYFRFIEDEVKSSIKLTTPLSAHFIALALDRRAGEDIKILFKAIAANEETAVEKAFSRVLSYGESSGRYIMKGIIWLLQKI